MVYKLHIGFDLDVGKSTNQRHDDMGTDKSKPEFARHTTYVVITRRL